MLKWIVGFGGLIYAQSDDTIKEIVLLHYLGLYLCLMRGDLLDDKFYFAVFILVSSTVSLLNKYMLRLVLLRN